MVTRLPGTDTFAFPRLEPSPMTEANAEADVRRA